MEPVSVVVPANQEYVDTVLRFHADDTAPARDLLLDGIAVIAHHGAGHVRLAALRECRAEFGRWHSCVDDVVELEAIGVLKVHHDRPQLRSRLDSRTG